MLTDNKTVLALKALTANKTLLVSEPMALLAVRSKSLTELKPLVSLDKKDNKNSLVSEPVGLLALF